MKACLYTRVPDKVAFERVGFYQQDIRIFSEIGFDLTYTHKLSEVPWDCDLYISWFPYWGALLWPIPAIKRKPHITIGAVDAAIPRAARRQRLKDFVLGFLEKWGVRHATLSVPISLCEEKAFIQLGARRTKMVYVSVDSDVYVPPPQGRTDSGLNQILIITHINEQNYLRKCIGSVIESIPLVLREHPNTQFILCGRQDSRVMERIVARVKNLRVLQHCVFPGHITDAEKLQYLQQCVIYLQPTLYEGFGLAIAEAMCCGLPVVTSAVGSIPEVVGDAGLFSPGDDPRLIAQQVSRLLADPALRDELGRAGRERICQKFSYPMRRAQIAQVVEEVMGDRLSAQITRNITQFEQDVH